MYSAIVVPLDGSTFGDRALPMAVALARRSDATLDLVHVHEPPVRVSGAPTPDARFEEEAERRQLTRTSELADLLARESGLTVRATCLHGEVAATLETFVAERAADLVVMTTHGRGGLSRAWLGSVADALVRRSPVPLLLVRPDTLGAPGPHEPLFHHVLVPLDGSLRADEVLTLAAALGTPGETEYHLLTVVSPRTTPGPVPDLAVVLARDDFALQLEEERARAETHLTRLADSFREIGARVSTHIAVHGQAARAILDFAHEHAIDLVVLSTRVRSATERFLIGSIADKVLRGADVPVLLCGPRVETARRHAETLSTSGADADPAAARG